MPRLWSRDLKEMADIVGVSKVGVCMSYGNEKQVDEDAPMRTRRKPKVYI